MTRPPLEDLTGYFKNYISQVKEDNLLNALIDQHKNFTTFLKFIPTDKEDYRYEKNKWTIKETIQHIIDTERVFAYRALCFSRKDENSLPSYEQDEYVLNSNANDRLMNEIIQEFDIVRQSTICLFKSFNNEHLHNKGFASNKESNALILGFTIAGHCTHHETIIKEKYL
jgi:DinB superfamily